MQRAEIYFFYESKVAYRCQKQYGESRSTTCLAVYKTWELFVHYSLQKSMMHNDLTLIWYIQ